MSFTELLEQLRNTEEVLLVELLEITSSDLVDSFIDKIEDNEERIRSYLGNNS